MSRSTLLVLIVAIFAFAILAVLGAVRSRSRRIGTPGQASAQIVDVATSENVASPPTPLASERALAGPSPIERSSPLDLASPQATVGTEIELFREGRDTDLRKTFLPSVSLTAEAIEACKRRIRSVPVRPDWEMAEDRVEQGHRVRRVSMFGKSMTGFHEIGHAWLADAVWCAPAGLP